jgi:hypothetical protein
MEYIPGEEPDPCLGTLPGVAEACCGHGNVQKAYVFFETGVLMRGFRKLEFHDLKRRRREQAEAQ